MNDSVGLERQVTEWLRSRATADGMDEVLAVSLARAAQVPRNVQGPPAGCPSDGSTSVH